MIGKLSVSDYTELEFIEFLELLLYESVRSDKRCDELVGHFKYIVEHPESTDLLFYASKENSSPQAITRIIKEWLKVNGKPGFKPPAAS